MVCSSSSSPLHEKLTDILFCYKLPTSKQTDSNEDELQLGEDSLACPKFWRAVIGEGLALALFIPLAVGSSVPWKGRDEPSNTQIALANGLMIATLIQCFSHVSGAHFNPAVTIPLAWNRLISVVCFYVISQCAGSSLGAKFLQVVTPEDVRPESIGCTLLGTGVDVWQGLMVELMISFQLVFMVFATIDPSRNDVQGSGAVAIGLSVATGLLYAVSTKSRLTVQYLYLTLNNLFRFMGVLHLLHQNFMFYDLSQNYQHLFEKKRKEKKCVL